MAKDYISRFNKAQADFAKPFAEQIMAQMPVEVTATMSEGELALLAANVEGNAILTMRWFAHWLATTLVRSGEIGKKKVRTSFYGNKEVAAAISKQSDVPVQFVDAFLSRIIQWNTEFPLVGKILDDKNEFHPNQAALEDYRACFD